MSKQELLAEIAAACETIRDKQTVINLALESLDSETAHLFKKYAFWIDYGRSGIELELKGVQE